MAAALTPYCGNEEIDADLTVQNQAITLNQGNRDARIPMAQVKFYQRLPLLATCTIRCAMCLIESMVALLLQKFPSSSIAILQMGRCTMYPTDRRSRYPLGCQRLVMH
jgi:hypothetical protein